MTTLGYKYTEEQRENISKAMMGNIPWNKGKICPQISEGLRGHINNAREKNPNWKGGFKNGDGYLEFLLPKGCRFSSMADVKGYVPMHRLMMAEYLQRPLTKEEVVHHINGDITDNRMENLELFENTNGHSAYHYKLRGGINIG